MSLAKDIASHLLKIEAVYLKPEEPFTWASGIKSPIYTDNRVTLAYPETRTLIENGFVDKIKEAFQTRKGDTDKIHEVIAGKCHGQ